MKTEEKKKNDLHGSQVIMDTKHVTHGNCYIKMIFGVPAKVLEVLHCVKRRNIKV